MLCSDPTVGYTPGLPSLLDSRKVFGTGTLDRMEDPRAVPRAFVYDARAALIRETGDYGSIVKTFLDKSGLGDSTRLRSGAVTRHRYDAAGRDTLMFFPTKQYTINGLPNPVPGDSVRRSYDALGNLLT